MLLLLAGVPAAKRAMAMLASSHIDCNYHADTDQWDIHIKGIRETDFKFKLDDGGEIQRVTEDGRKVTVSLLIQFRLVTNQIQFLMILFN